MNKLLLFFVAAVFAALPAWASPKEHGRGRGNEKHEREDRGRGHEEHGRSARYFRPADRHVILDYYSGPRRLPPGLERKMVRTGSLPPGWQKRFRPLPVVVVRQLPPVCATCGYGMLDGCAVVYDRRARVILDVLALVDDLR